MIASLACALWLWAVPGEPVPGLQSPESPGSPEALASLAPIGAACVDCHGDIVDTYRQTGMGRALLPLAPDEGARLVELGEVEESATGFRYRFEAPEGQRPRVVERWGEESAVITTAPVAFQIGAGLFDRAFAVERGGQLWFGPLEVMAEGGGHEQAVLAPAHSMDPGVRFTQPITRECLGCHTERLPEQAYPLNTVPAESWAPRGIGCTVCHGDVTGHVDWREADLAGEQPAGSDPVTNAPGRSLPERVSFCARCHLQGDARISLIRGERGLLPPGDDLLAHLGVWVAADYTEEIGFASQVERLVLSECFTASADRGAEALSCETCHDPHRSVFDPVEKRRVRAVCTTCHGDLTGPVTGQADGPTGMHGGEQAQDRDCIDCHMRRTPVFDLEHVEIHDHFIRREPPPPSSFEQIRSKQTLPGAALARFNWPGAAAPPHVGDPGLLLMALAAAGQAEAAAARVDSEPAREIRRLSQYHHLRGVALERLGRDEDARVAYGRALVLERGAPETAVNLSLVLSRLGRHAEALETIEAVLASYPNAEGALRNRGLCRLRAGDAEGAAADLEAAQRLLPSAVTARGLAQVFEQLGLSERAAGWRVEAQRLDPR